MRSDTRAGVWIGRCLAALVALLVASFLLARSDFNLEWLLLALLLLGPLVIGLLVWAALPREMEQVWKGWAAFGCAILALLLALFIFLLGSPKPIG